MYCFWGVLGEVELARDSLEEVTEAESESEKMLLDMPPGGLRTLQKIKKTIKITIKKVLFFLDAWMGIDREDYQKRSSLFITIIFKSKFHFLFIKGI